MKNQCLNRTFYGIETCLFLEFKLELAVLIVPFMELKHSTLPHRGQLCTGLNRTFYGIETMIAMDMFHTFCKS